MSQYSDLAISQGVTRLWPLDETSGNAVDLVAGHSLSPTGSPIYAEDAAVGQGVRFTNASSFFSSTSTSVGNFVASQPYSISFIMNAHFFSTPQGLFSKRVASATNVNFAVFIFTGNVLQFDLGGNQGRWTTGWLPDLNTWYHVAITWDPTDRRLRLYVNGVMTATTTSFNPTNGTNAPFTIGALGGSSTTIARSTLDMVGLFANKLLSASEVRAQYGAAFPITRIFNGTQWVASERRVL